MRLLRRSDHPSGDADEVVETPEFLDWQPPEPEPEPYPEAGEPPPPVAFPATGALPAARPGPSWPVGADLGLLAARLVLGGLAVLAGARTLVAVPAGGPGVTAAMLAGHGFDVPDLLARVLGTVDLVAGVLVLVGVFATPAASALLAVAVTALGVTAPVAVAAGTTDPAEGPLLSLALAAVVVLAGPGRCAGDAGRAWARAQTAVGTTFLLVGVATGLTVLFAFR